MTWKIADVAVDRNVSGQVRDIIFDAIKSIKKKAMQPDTISIIEYITRYPTNFKEVELRDRTSKLVHSGILINKNTSADIETPNYTLVEPSTKSNSDRFNDLKGEVNNNTANFSAFKSFVLDDLHKIKNKVYNLGIQNPDGSGFVENFKQKIKLVREVISSESLIKHKQS